MKRLFTIIAAVLLTAIIWAQSPQKMSYQAVVRNSNDDLVRNQVVGMQISILQGSPTGTPVYVETQTPTSNINGLVSIEIGGATGFNSIDWSDGPYYIKTETDPSGGTNYTITGVSQLLSVSYAFFANTAGGHHVGELFGGGIIVAVWKVAGIEHGLIASLTDVSTTAKWSNVNDLIGPTAQSSIDGQANTNAIITQIGHTASAAKLCNDYTNINTGTGVYSDWYLPAVWELNQCYHAGFIINTIIGVTNGFQSANYWSSTEDKDSFANAVKSAFSQNFQDGSLSSTGKGIACNVRAFRRY
jgi:hypothetical protein